ncbi:MAG: DUF4381 domain-containing protein [Mangrovibacterium sp.]
MDIIEPRRISYSFHTSGWEMVFALVIALFIILLLWLFIRWKQNKYRRDGVLFVQNCKSKNAVAEINRQLKITALQLWQRDDIASLQGEEWYIFLNSTMNNAYSDTNLFPQMAQANYTLIYDAATLLAFKQFSITWFKKHKK